MREPHIFIYINRKKKNKLKNKMKCQESCKKKKKKKKKKKIKWEFSRIISGSELCVFSVP